MTEAKVSPIPVIADKPNNILLSLIEKLISELLILGGNISTLKFFASRIYLLIIPALSLLRLNSALKKFIG